MHIAFIGARGIPHGYSSAEQIALHVGKRLVARGHGFTVYCRRHLFQDRAPVYDGVRRIFLPTFEHKIFGQFIHAFLAGVHAAARRYDVVHAQCLTNTYQVILPWLFRRNVVVNVDGQEWDNPKWPKTVRHIFFKSAARITLSMCREIITDARGMAQIYEERYGRRSTVIAYGAEIVESSQPEILHHYGLESKNYFFVAARLVPSNQIHTIVDAFQAANPTRMLAIAGGGDYGSAYVKALRARAGPKVKFLGLISNQEHMNELYANAYAYLHGATLGGINSALLRPLGAGCPAIAADTPFNLEVLERPGGTLCGRLWKDRQKLSEAVMQYDCDEVLVRKLAELSVRQIRENFTWDLVTDQYEVFYRGFIEQWPVERIRAAVSEQRKKYQMVPAAS